MNATTYRQLRGAKLSNAAVQAMREQRQRDGTPYADLGVAYGVSESAAYFACKGYSYRDAPGPVERKGR